jgi:hypothetical protein
VRNEKIAGKIAVLRSQTLHLAGEVLTLVAERPHEHLNEMETFIPENRSFTYLPKMG